MTYNARMGPRIGFIAQRATGYVIGVVVCLFVSAVLARVYTGHGYLLPTACVSNLKQVGLTFLMYENDYDDRLPPSSKWMDRLDPYRKDEHILHCPELINPNGGSADITETSPYGYAMDRFLENVVTTKLPEPEKMPLAYESTDLGRSATGFLTDVPNPGRHHGRNYLVYLDGHAKWFQGR